MKKAEYIEKRNMARKHGDVKSNGRSINGMDKPAGNKLKRKAYERKL